MYSHDVLWDYLEELDQRMLLHLHYNKKKEGSTILFTSFWRKYFSVLVHTCSLFLQWNIFWTPWHFASEFLSCLRRCTAPAVKHKSQQFESTFWDIKFSIHYKPRTVLPSSHMRKQPPFRIFSMVPPQNDVWGMNSDIPRWCLVTTQFRVVVLIGWQLLQPIKTTTQIWLVKHHLQWRI